jgi:hypothetical protein
MMKTKARKKSGQAAAAGVVGVGLLGVAFAAFPTGKGGAVAAGFIGFVLIALAWFSFWEADCPSCGKVVPLPVGDFLKCPHCRRYAKILPKELEAVADATVTPRPLFAIPLEGASLPDKCCVCAAPATRRTTLAATMEDTLPNKSVAEGLKKNAALGAGMRPMLKATVEVPHCGAHDAEAKIDRDEAPSGPFDAGSAHVVLRVRSYPFYRSALGL